jgi:hypothetical protein
MVALGQRNNKNSSKKCLKIRFLPYKKDISPLLKRSAF